MPIEARLGMIVIVILVIAFGFLVFQKFEKRQQELASITTPDATSPSNDVANDPLAGQAAVSGDPQPQSTDSPFYDGSPLMEPNEAVLRANALTSMAEQQTATSQTPDWNQAQVTAQMTEPNLTTIQEFPSQEQSISEYQDPFTANLAAGDDQPSGNPFGDPNQAQEAAPDFSLAEDSRPPDTVPPSPFGLPDAEPQLAGLQPEPAAFDATLEAVDPEAVYDSRFEAQASNAVSVSATTLTADPDDAVPFIEPALPPEPAFGSLDEPVVDEQYNNREIPFAPEPTDYQTGVQYDATVQVPADPVPVPLPGLPPEPFDNTYDPQPPPDYAVGNVTLPAQAPPTTAFDNSTAQQQYDQDPLTVEWSDGQTQQVSGLRVQGSNTFIMPNAVGSGGMPHVEGTVAVMEVKEGDSYWTLSRRAYGTIRYFSALAMFNQHRISHPKRMRPGMKVLIPEASELERLYPDLFLDARRDENNPEEAAGFFVNADGSAFYRVGTRDTLGGIAHRHLGRASQWSRIYELNRDILPNPDRLKPGTVIRMPATAVDVQIAP